jgi:hypothetical protein
MKYTIKQRRALKKRAWVVFSKWIRNRDNNRCITCGKTRDTLNKKGKKSVIYGGHYCHNREDFNERNINAQCYTCNWRKKGNMRFYTIYMVDKYGLDYVKELLKCEQTKPKLESGEFYIDVIRRYA